MRCGRQVHDLVKRWARPELLRALPVVGEDIINALRNVGERKPLVTYGMLGDPHDAHPGVEGIADHWRLAHAFAEFKDFRAGDDARVVLPVDAPPTGGSCNHLHTTGRARDAVGVIVACKPQLNTWSVEC